MEGVCGRLVLSTPPASVARLLEATLGLTLSDETFLPSWNVPPTAMIPGLLEAPSGDGRILSSFRWGLLPSWAKELSFGAKTINARVETVAEKPSFRAAFTQRHLIVPVDGYYEWQTLGEDLKQPHFITRTDGQTLLLAGLWEQWRAPQVGEEPSPLIRSCTILTRPANTDVGHLHDRMPVVVEPSDIDAWLTSLGEESEPMLNHLLNVQTGVLTARRVGKAVGSVRQDGPQLIEEVPGTSTLL